MPRRFTSSIASKSLEEWDAFHYRLDAGRFQKLDLLVDVLEARLHRRCVVLDLGAGPGPVAKRILDRLPQAKVVCYELDPVLKSVGEKALARYGARCRWVQADLREPQWMLGLAPGRVDAAISHLALHWMTAREMARFYRTLAGRLRKGGLFLNADFIPWAGKEAHLNSLAQDVREVRERRGIRSSRSEYVRSWEQWWAPLKRTLALREALAEHQERLTRKEHSSGSVGIVAQGAILRKAGFREVTTLWQDLNTRVLLGIR
jgi:SAM-dependent methyltransferase